MIAKIESYDAQRRLVTRWTPGVTSAKRYFDDDFQAEAVELKFAGDASSEILTITGKDGIYLCNDDGKTIDIISRLKHTVE